MKETRFKDTEIGKIPEEWSLYRFDDTFTFFPNNTLSRDMLGGKGGMYDVHYGDVLIKYGSILNAEKEDIPTISEAYCYKTQYVVKNGDIIIADTAEDETVGKVCEVQNVGNKCIVSGLHTMWVRPKDGVYAATYLGYAMNGDIYHNQLLRLIQGTKVCSISKTAIRETYIITPPISEQRRIASALTSIDNLISSLGQLIEKKKNVKQGAMQQLLTGKTRLKGFSEPWVEQKLGEVASICTGKRNGDENVPSGKYPFFVRSQEVYKIDTYSYDGEAIMVPGEGGIGSIFHYINGKFDYHQRVYKISDFANNIVGKFVYYYMRRFFGKYALENSVKATVDSLRLPTFENFEMNIPRTVQEQHAISAVLAKMDDEITALEAKKAKYEAVKQGMMQQLLTGKIRLIS